MEELLTINPINNLTDQFIYKIESTINELNSTAASSVEIQLKLYDVLIPLFGSFIITLNLLVVISSGLILKKGEYHSCFVFLFVQKVYFFFKDVYKSTMIYFDK